MAYPDRLLGDDEEVEAAYARIKRDDRHFACVELSRRAVDAPEFGPWAMAQMQPATPAAAAALRSAAARLTDSIPDPDVRALFTGFADLHSRAA